MSLFGDHSRDDARNIQHADNPQPGDYWHEMYCPIARVLMVDGDNVLIQELAGRGGTTVTLVDPQPKGMTRKRFAEWLRYDTIPDKTWAEVVPAQCR